MPSNINAKGTWLGVIKVLQEILLGLIFESFFLGMLLSYKRIVAREREREKA